MGKQTWVKANGMWKKVKSVWIKIDDIWRKNSMPRCVVDDSYKEFMNYYKCIFMLMRLKDENEYYLLKTDENLNEIKKVKIPNLTVSYSSQYIAVDANRKIIYVLGERGQDVIYVYDYYLNLIKTCKNIEYSDFKLYGISVDFDGNLIINLDNVYGHSIKKINPNTMKVLWSSDYKKDFRKIYPTKENNIYVQEYGIISKLSNDDGKMIWGKLNRYGQENILAILRNGDFYVDYKYEDKRLYEKYDKNKMFIEKIYDYIYSGYGAVDLNDDLYFTVSYDCPAISELYKIGKDDKEPVLIKNFKNEKRTAIPIIQFVRDEKIFFIDRKRTLVTDLIGNKILEKDTDYESLESITHETGNINVFY